MAVRGRGPTVIDLFAGCGGMTSGFVAEGFRPVKAIEWDLAAAATYASNFGDHVICGDIGSWRREIPEADVVIGGPPCQGFSNLGTKNPDDSARGGGANIDTAIFDYNHSKSYVSQVVGLAVQYGRLPTPTKTTREMSL